jgi:hypothetical protein
MCRYGQGTSVCKFFFLVPLYGVWDHKGAGGRGGGGGGGWGFLPMLFDSSFFREPWVQV